jgi:hypothetical protein
MRMAAFDPRVRTLSAFDPRVRTLNGMAAARFMARQRYLQGLACACQQQQLGRLRGLRGLRGLGRFGRIGDDPSMDIGTLPLGPGIIGTDFTTTVPILAPQGQFDPNPSDYVSAQAAIAAGISPAIANAAFTPLTQQELANLASTSGQFNTPGDPNVYNAAGQIVATLNASQQAKVAALVGQGVSLAAARQQALLVQPQASFLGSIPSWVLWAGVGVVGLTLLTSGSRRR